MNLVGQLAETVFVTVKELYRGLNPATLTGGIDVIVVRQPDGSYQCSPFHVRFGKLGVLRSKEKVVDIEINGEPVNLHMKLGDNGEAFFVEENEDMESIVPAHLCTSPIPTELLEENGGEENGEGGGGGGLPARRKKRRRKRVRSGSHLREEGSSSSDEREQESPVKEPFATSLQVSKSIYFSISEEPGSTQTTREVHPHSEGECSPSEGVFHSRPSSPKSDSELVVRPQESSGPQMQWNWGGFPKVCQSERSSVESQRISTSDRSHFRTIERQDSFDDSVFQTTIHCSRAGGVTVVRPHPRTVSLDLGLFSSQANTPTPERTPLLAHSTPNGPPDAPAAAVSVTTDTLVESLTQTDSRAAEEMSAEGRASDPEPEDRSIAPVKSTDPEIGQNRDEISAVVESAVLGNVSQECTEGKACAVARDALAGDKATSASAGGSVSVTGRNSIVESLDSIDVSGRHSATAEPGEMGATNTISVSNGDCVETNEEGGSTVTDRKAEGLQLTNQTADISQDATKAEQLDKKKGKRSQHLGPKGIYLDDLTRLDPEVAALYFPKSDAEAASRSGADQGSNSGTQSPQSLGSGSVGSGAVDSGTEYLSDSTADHMDVSMSLCGRVGDISQEKFKEHIVTYKDFFNNPGIIEDPNLVICINSKYYNWAVAAPMVLSKQAFHKNLPKSAVDRLVKDKMPRKSGRWWFSWRRRDSDINQPQTSTQEQEEVSLSAPTTIKATLDDMYSDEEAGLGRQAAMPTDSLSTDTMSQCISQMYRKSLRLTSEQIERLNLRDGANQVVFSVTTQYQGTCRCEAAIYLWKWDDRVIISDIDGTITKSDALGHILPQFGKDWTHQGIAKLYHKIHKNGYKFLYCSARAIGMAAITKDYLQWVNDKGTVLPKGPVLLAPSSLFSALHREVIEKKPEVFKVACLADIKDLFNPQRRPFYAAFGNRTNDAYAYQQVGVPDTRIFTINPKGELTQEKTKGNKSSYNHLGELVEHFFPVLSVRSSSASAFDCPEFSHFSYWREPLPPLDLEALS
ncbi:unnamed protein product [Merluccius merluccius]